MTMLSIFTYKKTSEMNKEHHEHNTTEKQPAKFRRIKELTFGRSISRNRESIETLK